MGWMKIFLVRNMALIFTHNSNNKINIVLAKKNLLICPMQKKTYIASKDLLFKHNVRTYLISHGSSIFFSTKKMHLGIPSEDAGFKVGSTQSKPTPALLQRLEKVDTQSIWKRISRLYVWPGGISCPLKCIHGVKIRAEQCTR